jgi:hypothetical protein
VKIHSSKLTGRDLHEALSTSGQAALGVSIDEYDVHNSRSHALRFDVHLIGDGTTSRFKCNSGEYGAGRAYSAGYDAWGWWLADLFDRDPDAWAGPYKGRLDFDKQTHYRFARNH